MGKNYNKMYNSRNQEAPKAAEEFKTPVVDEEESVVAVTDPVVDDEVKASAPDVVNDEKETFPKTGRVTGGASLNIRANTSKTSPIVTTLTNGTALTIEEEAGDFYKISKPAAGCVMKKYGEARVSLFMHMERLEDTSPTRQGVKTYSITGIKVKAEEVYS